MGCTAPVRGRRIDELAFNRIVGRRSPRLLDDVAALCGLLRNFTDADWRTLRSLARAHGCRRRLAVGLCLARDLGGLSIQWPQSCLAGFPGADGLSKEAEAFLLGSRPGWWAQLLRVSAGVKGGATVADERSGRLDCALGVLWQARTLDSRRAGLRHLWRRLSTSGSRDWALADDARPVWLPGPLAQLVRRQRRLWGR